MKVADPEQMKEIDNVAITQMGIPGVVLMENAAVKVVDEIEKSLGSIRGKNIMILAGKGNNGGDAFAAARHLHNKGSRVKVFITAAKQDVRGDASVNLNILERLGVSMVELTEASELGDLRQELHRADLVVDGIFGTGLKGPVHGVPKGVIEIVNDKQIPVISIDIPSGVCGKTGKILGSCIKAAKTVTFVLPKTGLVIHPGCDYAGELIIADIGVPNEIFERMNLNLNIIDGNMVSSLIPGRFGNSNKGDYGKVFIVSGSVGMTGSGSLAAGAALRTGAGLVYLGVPARLTSVYDTLLRESVTIPLPDTEQGCLSRKCMDQIKARMGKMNVAAVGPGLSVTDDTIEIVSKIIEASDIPLVLDADALNAIAKDISVLKKLSGEAVITPHPGEMARLVGISIDDVQNNRIDVAREFAGRWRVITVLKGSRTVVALPDGNVYINSTGNSGMASAGSGDVLTGVIAGLIGQGMKPSDGAVAGVYLHGLAGDNAAKIKGEHGMIAGDIIDELPHAIKESINADNR